MNSLSATFLTSRSSSFCIERKKERKKDSARKIKKSKRKINRKKESFFNETLKMQKERKKENKRHENGRYIETCWIWFE